MARPNKLFSDCYTPDPNSGCWLWTSGWDVYGYGSMSGNVKAHRHSYSIHVGPIPSQMMVCHKCDTPCCVNPSHLFLGTNAENTRDKMRKNRQAKGLQTKLSKITDTDVVTILESKESCAVLAKKFGITDVSVSNVRLGKTWKHVQRPIGYAYVKNQRKRTAEGKFA